MLWVRNSSLFCAWSTFLKTNRYSALRYSTSEICEYKEYALKLTNSLVNVRDIVNHFTPKIESWLASQSLSTPTEEQILALVIQNYDSLTLKLQDSLDQYERYSEKPKHTSFFTNMVISVFFDKSIEEESTIEHVSDHFR